MGVELKSNCSGNRRMKLKEFLIPTENKLLQTAKIVVIMSLGWLLFASGYHLTVIGMPIPFYVAGISGFGSDVATFSYFSPWKLMIQLVLWYVVACYLTSKKKAVRS